MTTSDDVADIVDWMVSRLAAEKCLYQHEVIDRLHRQKLSALVRENDSGGESLIKAILDQFKKRTLDAVWVRSEQMWRPRESTDTSGRMQD